MSTSKSASEAQVAEYVTVMIGEQLFGLPIARVQDVFMPQRLTRVPLAPADIAGPRSICVAGWDCRRAPSRARRWRSASSATVNRMAC
jgi:hypothetical protein